jgi:hypothetical protein
MPVGYLTLYLRLPGCVSLKEKRSRLKPLLARLHREFNVSVAEMERNNAWQEAILGCALASNDAAHSQRVLHHIVHWIETHWHDVDVLEDVIEVL